MVELKVANQCSKIHLTIIHIKELDDQPWMDTQAMIQTMIPRTEKGEKIALAVVEAVQHRQLPVN